MPIPKSVFRKKKQQRTYQKYFQAGELNTKITLVGMVLSV